MLSTALGFLLLGLVADAAKVEITDNLLRFGNGSMLYPSQHQLYGRPSYRFGGSESGTCLLSQITKKVTNMMSNSCSHRTCFTFSTLLRLEKKNFEGTLISIKSPSGGLLEVHYKKSIQFRVNYKSGGVEQSIRFFYGFPRNHWTHFALVVCPAEQAINVYVNCLQVFKMRLRFPMDCFKPTAQTEHLCVGRSWPHISRFLGSLQNMTFYSGSDEVSRMCPAIGVDTLWKQRYEALKAQTQTIEMKMKQMLCDVDGVQYLNGTTTSTPCKTCMCTNGNFSCTTVKCPMPSCSHYNTTPANPAEGRCCPTYSCAKSVEVDHVRRDCRMDGRVYQTNESFYRASDPNHCTPCVCSLNGVVRCFPKKCPILTCPQRQQFFGPSDCCFRCVPDHCATQDCGDGECRNQADTAACVCHEGARFVHGRCVGDPSRPTQATQTFFDPKSLLDLLGR